MPLDNNIYYPAGNITVFPASNGVDIGKIHTELNDRNITINITDLNYVVSPNPGGYDLSLVDNKIQVNSGKAIINGFEVNTDTKISIDLPTTDKLYTGEKYKDKWEGYALLCLHTIFDSLNNLSGNVQIGSTWYLEGINLCYTTADEYENHENEYLLLGGVKEDGTIKQNDGKYTRYDPKYIQITIKADDETGAPPSQTVLLENFINNILKGYWVSKAGDNEYGTLLFKDMPEHYLEPNFDSKTEDSLTSEYYYLKLYKDDNGGYINLRNPVKNQESSTNVNIGPNFISFNNEKQSNPNLGFENGGQFFFYNEYPDFKLYCKGEESGFGIYPIEGEHCILNSLYYNKNENKQLASVETKSKISSNVHYYNVVGDNISHSNKFEDTNYGIASYSDNFDSDYHTKISMFDAVLRFDKNQNNKVWSSQLNLIDNVSESWSNILNFSDNLNVENNFRVHGFIASTQEEDPSAIEVPDFADAGGMRKLQAGDIYTDGKVWSAVYNDIAEIFEVDAKPGQIIAINEQGKYEVADRKKHNNIVGVVSKDPAICCGSNGKTPIALVGRINVNYTGKTPKVGSAMCLSKIPGCAKIGNKHSKYFIGIVTKIIDDNQVEILVK